ncbi:acyl carrier protein [Bradyrhizobium sp. 215_C5_N1_1]|jgi:acyl carrier protein|uniref:Acyl carrier protein n=1 Tax=Bradyrhizobium barranii subsp. barranii TaxID=2823807 RepID=A0A7Z0QFJ0_9BRAD|nr:acyl carrier protein [Bradyrhizobium barranii]UGX99208.1 acyl carrier protein [Bradyrhizobium barranii subsp. barranii]
MTLVLAPDRCKEQIRAFLTSNFYISDIASLNDDASLLDQGIIDSTGVLEVVGFIETTFGIAVDDNEILPENLDSIRGMARYIASKVNLAADT